MNGRPDVLRLMVATLMTDEKNRAQYVESAPELVAAVVAAAGLLDGCVAIFESRLDAPRTAAELRTAKEGLLTNLARALNDEAIGRVH